MLAKSRKLGEEEAHWLGRIHDAPIPMLRLRVPFKVAGRLLIRGLAFQDGPIIRLTEEGVEAVLTRRAATPEVG